MISDAELLRFPGGGLVAKGLADLRHGQRTEEALLLLVARPRLVSIGLEIPEPWMIEFPEHALYEAIEKRCPDGAHAEYNALIHRIVSFANAYP